MKLLIALIIIALALVLFAMLLLAAGAIWWSRSTSRHPGDRTRAAASAFLRDHERDRRLPSQLRHLAADARVPMDARLLVTALVRCLAEPVSLAPAEVPILGQLDETSLGSVLLWLAWGRIPAEAWAAHLPSDHPSAAQPPTTESTSAAPGGRLAVALRRDAAAGRHEAVLRRLDRELPDWPVSATLVEVARELLELERNVETARAAGVPNAVTDRLTEEALAASEALWRRADRLAAVAAYRIESPSLQEALDREDEHLARLRASLREARAGLAELTLSEGRSEEAFRRAEGRFRALAATARDLQALDREMTP